MKDLPRKLRIASSTLIVPRSRRRLLSVRVGPDELLVFANEDVGRSLVAAGQFEKAETEFFKSGIRPSDVCLDIGGNVGYFTLVMARAASSGVVHVFEPIPLNVAVIKTNVELNALRNVVVHQIALGETNGSVQFSVANDSAYSSMMETGRKATSEVIDVPGMSLDHFLDQYGIRKIDVMKVDVEGAEGLVLRGAKELFGDPASRPRLIMMELFQPNLNPFGEKVEVLVDLLKSYGYDVGVVNRDGFADYTSPIDFEKHVNIVFRYDA